jgi:hypothetical protein
LQRFDRTDGSARRRLSPHFFRTAKSLPPIPSIADLRTQGVASLADVPNGAYFAYIKKLKMVVLWGLIYLPVRKVRI